MTMFAAYCPTHQSPVLLGPGNIEGLHNTPRGITVRFRCYCGHRGAFNDGTLPNETS